MLVKGHPWQGRRVLITGASGFKGGWLSLWLQQQGAQVTGYSLEPPSNPSFFEQVKLGECIEHVHGDIRDLDAVCAAVERVRPDVIFHLAAQPLVRLSYDEPVETYAVNVMGTVNILEACRRVGGVKAAVCVTSDKCYENREWVWPYREEDPMGGHDPYSSSKGAAEIVVSAYRRSYFGKEGTLVASVRAGNVIGGGDWALDRLIPDIVRALQAGERPVIRSPHSIRPWQHVFDALSGYILVAERLLAGDRAAASAFNFGPSQDDARPVSWIVRELVGMWGGDGWDEPKVDQPHEAFLLKLDSSKAHHQLGWQPRYDLRTALHKVVEWHRGVGGGGDARALSVNQLEEYNLARGKIDAADGVIA